MRDYESEKDKRVEFIRELVKRTGVCGIVFGSSGGKDSALVGILSSLACENTIGVIMPCGVSRNYGEDKAHAQLLARQFGIESRVVDLTPVREALCAELEKCGALTVQAISNIAPRLRMSALYAIAHAESLLVAGTGNSSESYMGYFTKWGDNACDFNPISDLTVTEIFEFLEYLNAPREIIEKAPSGALFEGQTDELEMGISYARIDKYLLENEAVPSDLEIISAYHNKSAHKRAKPIVYKSD